MQRDQKNKQFSMDNLTHEELIKFNQTVRVNKNAIRQFDDPKQFTELKKN